jgi:hypothetical protein
MAHEADAAGAHPRSAQSKCKSARSMELIGCSVPEFLLWMEKQFLPGMTWENHGPVWHIDHNRRCKKFNLRGPKQQRACCHYSNMQTAVCY